MDRAPFLEMSDELWHRIFDTNLHGAFLCGQITARAMVAQGDGGRFVNVASNSGIFGGRVRAAYGASKAGLINLTQTMAQEWAPEIRVNVLVPGSVYSPHRPTSSGASAAPARTTAWVPTSRASN